MSLDGIVVRDVWNEIVANEGRCLFIFQVFCLVKHPIMEGDWCQFIVSF